MKKAPDYIQFYPTLRCNRSCEFCFNKNMPSMPDTPLADFHKMLGRLKRIGVKTIDIIGGEPTLHKDILPMIQEAEQNGFRVNISSNGTDIETLFRILETTNNTNVGVSINDPEMLASLREFIQKYRTVVKAVFGPHLDFSMVQDILALKPKKFYLLYRDAILGEDLGATLPFDRFLALVHETFDPSVVGTVYCSGFLPDIRNYPDLAYVRCPAGTTKLGVMPDGSVYPCNLFFGIERFRIGNILTDQFENIWNHSALSFFRTFAGNACPRSSCELHAQCHGGCPAHSLVHSGKLPAPDPRCKKS